MSRKPGSITKVTHQCQALDEECPEAEEAAHDEACENALDLRDTRSCRVLGQFLHKMCRSEGESSGEQDIYDVSGEGSVTPGMPVLVSPIQSVLRNSGEERRKMPCRLISSNLSESARVSRMADP